MTSVAQDPPPDAPNTGESNAQAPNAGESNASKAAAPRAPSPHQGAPARRSPWPAAAGLALTPLVVTVAYLSLSTRAMGESAASSLVFAGAALPAIAGLAIAATARDSWRFRLGLAAVAGGALIAFAILGVSAPAAAVAVDGALVALAWGVGTSIGGRIQHPGHLLPACAVAAAADLASVLSSLGPSHAIAKSERALSVVAIGFPVPGTTSFAPALGVGDLVFMAIVMGAAASHGISIVRTASLCVAGTCVAGAASAWWGVAVPALVPIVLALVAGLPEVRRLRREDRRVATVAVAIAVSVAIASVVSTWLEPPSAEPRDER